MLKMSYLILMRQTMPFENLELPQFCFLQTGPEVFTKTDNKETGIDDHQKSITSFFRQDFERKNYEYMWKAATAICARLTRLFHCIMCCSYFLTGYLIWLCDL